MKSSRIHLDGLLRLASEVERFALRLATSEDLANRVAKAAQQDDEKELVELARGTGVFSQDVEIEVRVVVADVSVGVGRDSSQYSNRIQWHFCLLPDGHCCVDL
jgi:hypothetical protein